VQSVYIGTEDITIHRGDSGVLTPYIRPENATDRRAVFTSSNDRVASVDQNGRVRAVGPGTAVITCTIGGVSAQRTITVTVPVTSVTVTLDRRGYTVGGQGFFTVQVQPADACDPSYTITVSGSAIAMAGGEFVCVEGGEATITATASSGVAGRQTITVIDLSAFANEVFRLTNIERDGVGLPHFTTSSIHNQAATVRANEIIRHFSHDRPDGRRPFTVYTEHGITYSWAGENIAAGQRSPAQVIREWMDSPGHKANIVKPEHGRLGVGVVMNSEGRLFWVQLFAD